MKRKQQRICFIFLILFCVTAATAFVLTALKDKGSFFYSPSQVYDEMEKKPQRFADGKKFRIGGFVERRSIIQRKGGDAILFIVTDKVDSMAVRYEGQLPDMFGEEQDVVAYGAFDDRGMFLADEITANTGFKFHHPTGQPRSLQ